MFDFIFCWIPLGSIEYAPLGVQKECGGAGVMEGHAVRLRTAPGRYRYAVVWTANGCVHGANGARVCANRREPMLDREAIEAVAGWTTRAKAQAEAEQAA